MTHELKILPQYFAAVMDGSKPFEIRKNDRNFKPHDDVILREWDGKFYTGRKLQRWVGYVYYGTGEYGLAEGYCVLGLTIGPPAYKTS